MVHVTRDSFNDLELFRQELQNNIKKLSKSLRHWQLWEAEYEGLKDEILSVTPISTREKLTTICRQFDGELLNESEINDILGISTPRDVTQILNLLERRIDYVERNIGTIQKQIQVAQNNLAVSSVSHSREIISEDDLPVIEIKESLDDQGNITSSQVSIPSSIPPQISEKFQKAGVNNLPKSVKANLDPFTTDKNRDFSEEPGATATTKKFVSFADTVKSDFDQLNLEKLQIGQQIMNSGQEYQRSTSKSPIIPIQESVEDSALRQDMLQYGMLEVDSVVAELELENESDWSAESYEEDATSNSDEEDDFGRYTGRVVNDRLRQRIVELEERVSKHKMKSIGNEASGYKNLDEGIERVIVHDDTNQSLGQRKMVRFSDHTDVSLSPVFQLARSGMQGTEQPSSFSENNAFQDDKSSVASDKASELDGLYRSMLKTSSTSSRTPITATIIERLTPKCESVIENNVMETKKLHQEVATEYYKLRNMLIQRDGGFMKEDTSEKIQFSEEEGGPKKMSRFKAARLSRC